MNQYNTIHAKLFKSGLIITAKYLLPSVLVLILHVNILRFTFYWYDYIINESSLARPTNLRADTIDADKFMCLPEHTKAGLALS